MAEGVLVLDLVLENLIAMTPPLPPVDAICHRGLVPQEKCARCSRIAAALAAIEIGRQHLDSATGRDEHAAKLAKRRAARAAKKAAAAGA